MGIVPTRTLPVQKTYSKLGLKFIWVSNHVANLFYVQQKPWALFLNYKNENSKMRNSNLKCQGDFKNEMGAKFFPCSFDQILFRQQLIGIKM